MALPQFAQPILQHVAPAIGAAVADATAAASIVQEAAAARTHAVLMAVQATTAANQAQISATLAADEIRSLAGRLDHAANDRAQELAAASIASEAAQACNAQIAQAHADLADVGTPSQALSGVPAEDRGGSLMESTRPDLDFWTIGSRLDSHLDAGRHRPHA